MRRNRFTQSSFVRWLPSEVQGKTEHASSNEVYRFIGTVYFVAAFSEDTDRGVDMSSRSKAVGLRRVWFWDVTRFWGMEICGVVGLKGLRVVDVMIVPECPLRRIASLGMR